jgi:hypothetical protein
MLRAFDSWVKMSAGVCVFLLGDLSADVNRVEKTRGGARRGVGASGEDTDVRRGHKFRKNDGSVPKKYRPRSYLTLKTCDLIRLVDWIAPCNDWTHLSNIESMTSRVETSDRVKGSEMRPGSTKPHNSHDFPLIAIRHNEGLHD